MGLTIHLSHGPDIVIWILEADKAIAFCLASAFVSDNFGLQEGRVTAEGTGQDVVVHLIAQVTTEDPEIIWGNRKEELSRCHCGQFDFLCTVGLECHVPSPLMLVKLQIGGEREWPC